jgi:chemotaxis protein MotB
MIQEKRKKTYLHPDEASIWISISDLMSGLLIIFILTLTYYMLSYTEKTHHITKTQEIKEKIFAQIKEKMRTEGFTVIIDDKQWVLRMDDKVLFNSCSADIKDEGESLVKVLGVVMFAVFSVDEYKKSVETVFIEGHTDNVRPGKDCVFPTNWELSTKRSINTWNALLEGEPGLGNLRNINKERIFSVSGYGETRPIESNESKAGREKNRRIDVRIAMMPPSNDSRPATISQVENNISGEGNMKS